MLKFFQVEHATDGKTICRIYVEPSAKQCSAMILIERLIICQTDETDATFKSTSSAEWQDISYWERKAASIAKAWSPFWKGESAA